MRFYGEWFENHTASQVAVHHNKSSGFTLMYEQLYTLTQMFFESKKKQIHKGLVVWI